MHRLELVEHDTERDTQVGSALGRASAVVLGMYMLVIEPRQPAANGIVVVSA